MKEEIASPKQSRNANSIFSAKLAAKSKLLNQNSYLAPSLFTSRPSLSIHSSVGEKTKVFMSYFSLNVNAFSFVLYPSALVLRVNLMIRNRLL